MMKRAITEISQITDAPLAIDTGDVKALEAGLRAYPGRALINSVSAEPDRLKEFLPLLDIEDAIEHTGFDEFMQQADENFQKEIDNGLGPLHPL